MEIRNFSGISRSFTPFPITSEPLSKDEENPSTTFNISIEFYDGLIPTAEDIATISTLDELLVFTSMRTKLLSYDNLGFYSKYDENQKIRMFKKVPISNTSGIALASGTPTWAVIIFQNNETAVTERSLIFTESIGDWELENKMIYLSTLTFLIDEEVFLKDIVFNVKDVCTTTNIVW